MNDESPPSSSKASISMYRDTLAKKADEKWVESELESLGKTLDETKKIALSAKRKAGEPHGCLHEDVIKDVGNWKNIRFMAVIAFLVVAGGVLASYFALKDKVEDTEEAMIEYKAGMASVKADLAEVKIDIQQVKSIVKEDRKRESEKDKKQIEEIRLVITEAIAAQNTHSRRRR